MPASADQLELLAMCSSCRDILDGARRRTFATLDAALEALPVPVENRARMRQIAAGLTIAQVWIPPSGSYIAVAAEGQAASAYFNKGFVDVRREAGGYDRHEMPSYRSGSRSGVRDSSAGVQVALCPSCFMQLPANGACDACDG
ncbi:hypothetical protein GCM10010972_34300 [Cellulomonas carbonis]|nr:hypothetical protein GCM10010972_34300 [Cellulomonas carbonis]